MKFERHLDDQNAFLADSAIKRDDGDLV